MIFSAIVGQQVLSTRNNKMSNVLLTNNEKTLINKTPITSLVKRYGTPLLIINRSGLKANYEKLRAAFRSQGLQAGIFYSVKTNNNPVVCKVMKSIGTGAEVVSTSELSMIKKLGFNSRNIIYNSPCKKTHELEMVMNLGVKLINCDSIDELEQVNSIAARLGILQGVGIRIDPLENATNRFGVSPEEAISIVKATRNLNAIKLSAIHFHVGTKVINPVVYYESLLIAIETLKTIRRRLKYKIGCIDIGGGFPSLHDLLVQNLDFSAYAKVISQALKEKRQSHLHLILEPGRSLVGDAVMCVAQVVAIKCLKGILWAVIDVGTNSLPPLKSADYVFMRISSDKLKTRYLCRLAGPLCMGVDYFMAHARLELGKGDYVAILNAGAYTVSFFNNFCVAPPRIVFVDIST